jgi:DNA repair exonuclease SbcCD ATPase subunit
MNTETTKRLQNKPGAWIAITTERNRMNTETTKQLQDKLIDTCDAMLGLVNMSSEQLVKINQLERELAEVREQRDTLAEALEALELTAGQSTLWDDPVRHKARQALAIVKGGDA